MKVKKDEKKEKNTRKEGIIPGLSITARIAAWYTLLLFLAMLVLMLTLLHFYDLRIQSAAEHKLHSVVDDVGDAITDAGDNFILDKKIRYYYRDAYISIYEMDGDLITGRLPRGIDEFPALNPEQIQVTEDSDGGEWYVFDDIIEAGDKKVYIRGMLSGVAKEGRIYFEIKMFVILLPTLLLIAALGGYLVTRRAFDPIMDIIKTTKEIERERDLSLRIPLGKSRDEIYELSESFNSMFDRVEDIMQREKQFTADVSHELRTPLAVIQAQSEYAMEDESYAGDAARIINNESRRLSTLISNLLMIARSDAGRMTPDYKDTDVTTLLEEIAEVMTSEAEEAGQTLETDIQDGIKTKTDADMLIRIIVNLLSNSIQYGKGEGGRIRLSAREADGEIVCIVSDDGEGVREEDREKIWERFYQSDEARSNKTSTGIGLSIVQALAKALGGKVELMSDEESELGGASFRLSIPGKQEGDRS